jgi:DNA polymerase III delta prime subunit
MKKNAKEINDMVENAEKYRLNENQIKVGKALVELLTNWEDIFSQMGSNKFNKSSILLFLKECTLMNTKEIRDSMRVFKNQYYDIKKAMIDE